MELRKEVLKGLKWTTISTITSMSAKLIQVIVLARILTKEDFGIVSIALLFIVFTDIFLEMGLSSAVLHKPNITKQQISSLFWFNIFSGIIIFLMMCLASPIISNFYNIRDLNEIIPLLSTTILFSSFSRLQKTIQQKNLQFGFISVIEILASIFMAILAVILAVNNYGIYSLVYSTISNSLFISIAYFFKALSDKNITFHFNLKDIKPYIKIGVYQLQSSLLDFFSREIDVIIISKTYSIEILGAYSLCKQLVLRIYGIINPTITKVITPIFASIQDDKILIKSKYLELIKYLSFINYPIYFFFAALANPILAILYGDQYTLYSFPLAILSINYAILSIGNPVGSLQIALGRTDIGFYWTIYRIISVIIFMSIGSLFRFDIFISFILINNIFNIYPSIKIMISKLIPLSFTEYMNVQLSPILISSVIMLIVYNINLPLTTLSNLITKTCIFIFTYVVINYIVNKNIVFDAIRLIKQ